MKSTKLSLIIIISLIILLSILVFNSIKIKIEYFNPCATPTVFPNCESEKEVNILYLNKPSNITSNPQKGIQTKYNCNPLYSLDCKYHLELITPSPSIP